MSTTPLLDSLRRSGALRPLDLAFARTLARLDPDTPDHVLAAAALASLAVANGHAGFDPREPRRLVDADIDWPPPDAWRAALAASRWVACPPDGDAESAADAPLVLEGAADGPGLLYLRRYREYERRLAHGLRRIGAQTPAMTDLEALSPLFARLFPDSVPLPPGDESPSIADLHGEAVRRASTREDASQRARRADEAASERMTLGRAVLDNDLQARAAAIALRHALLLVTGGPGTGKTTTTARLLVLLVAQALQAGAGAPRIALAAPTGRAAERMAESVRHAVQALAAAGIDAALLAPLPGTGTTLHRLLGTIPDSPRFRHHADDPLPFDVVVVDEASMVDLPLMAKLVEAIADGARLVLLGDPDQLPSVEAGDVLGGILRAAGDGTRIARDDADALAPLLGASDHAAVDPPAFPGRHVHLRRGYRQSASLDLAPLAAAVRDGDAAAALRLLRGGQLSGVHFHEGLADPLQAHRDRLLAHWTALADVDDPADALALAGRLRLLTAVREGPQGARSLNARIEALLSGSGLAGAARRTGSTHFHGRLLLVTENSYRQRLFNGDIGICLRNTANPVSGRTEGSLAAVRDDDSTVTAWFPGDDPRHPRAFHPAALPAHESAFAMTVHKAQGSEFDEVWLLLPKRFNRALSRELVYTGMTRARRELRVAANAEVIADALARHAGRWSGLGKRLDI